MPPRPGLAGIIPPDAGPGLEQRPGQVPELRPGPQPRPQSGPQLGPQPGRGQRPRPAPDLGALQAGLGAPGAGALQAGLGAPGAGGLQAGLEAHRLGELQAQLGPLAGLGAGMAAFPRFSDFTKLSSLLDEKRIKQAIGEFGLCYVTVYLLNALAQ